MENVLIPILVAIPSFIVLLALIVFIHEYAHFKTARLCGVRVDTFSIGFGPALFSWTDKHGTVWKVAALPLGGFVKFFGDANAASAGTSSKDGVEGPKPVTTQFNSAKDRLAAVLTEEEKNVCFHFKPVWQRFVIVAAGPVSNFILGAVIYAVMLMAIGVQITEPIVSTVQEDSAAAEAGFEEGDRIVSINGRQIDDFNDLRMVVILSSNTPLDFVVDRNGQQMELTATPRRTETVDAFGNEVKMGILGISASTENDIFKRYGPVEAVAGGVARVGDVLQTTLRYLGRLVTGREDTSQLGGPISIAKYAGQATMFGFNPDFEIPLSQRILASLQTFFSLAAGVSISIGFLNLLPIPVLDGGHLVFYTYEAIAGRPLSDRIQAVGFQIGFVLLATFMIFVIINDVMKFL